MVASHDEETEDADRAKPQKEDDPFEVRLGHARRW